MILWLQGIHFEFQSALSLVVILALFGGLLAWLTYMAWTQRKLIKDMVTRKEFNQAFEDFRKEMQQNEP